jgi:hypothetical protein
VADGVKATVAVPLHNPQEEGVALAPICHVQVLVLQFNVIEPCVIKLQPFALVTVTTNPPVGIPVAV